LDKAGEGMGRLSEEEKDELSKKQALKQEIKETLTEWENANRFFHYAVGKEQVDYAIYNIITAEKRYDMLLGKAKQMQGPWPKWEGIVK
jgi:hypothetical protein